MLRMRRRNVVVIFFYVCRLSLLFYQLCATKFPIHNAYVSVFVLHISPFLLSKRNGEKKMRWYKRNSRAKMDIGWRH